MHSASYNMLIVTLAVQCCVSSGVDFEAACYTPLCIIMLLFVLLFLSRALSCCKCEMGPFMVIHEREPNPHFGKFV